MRLNYFLLSFFFFSICQLPMLTSCSKQGCNDKRASNYNPEVTKNNGTCVYLPGLKMLGETPVQVNVGSIYIDDGAVAMNADGSEVYVQTDNQVNTSKKGMCKVNYSADLKSGKETLTRMVNVIIDRNNWVGTWKRSSDCDLFFPDSLVTFVLGEENKQIQTTDMFDTYSPETFIFASINEQQISIPEQYLQQNMWNCLFSANGEMNDEANAFKLKVNYFNQVYGGSPFGGHFTCLLKYTKVE